MSTHIDQALAAHELPVILLEGTRRLPPVEQHLLIELARHLCARFPRARFRSGNAEGSDTVFAQEVARHDPSRLELVLPHAGMGRARRPPNSRCFSLDSLSLSELDRIVTVTHGATQSAWVPWLA